MKKKIQNLSRTHCRYRQGYNKAKSHSFTREQGVRHAGSSPKVMEKINFKMNLNPTAGIGRSITKPNLTHSQLNKGSSMLDRHPHSWKNKFQSESQPHRQHQQGYNEAKSHSFTREQGVQHAGSSPKVMEKINFKMNLNPTAGIGRSISKPNLTHSQLNKGFNMLDRHLHSWKNKFQNESQPHCQYWQEYNEAKIY
jgi:hypothetical protein